MHARNSLIIVVVYIFVKIAKLANNEKMSAAVNNYPVNFSSKTSERKANNCYLQSSSPNIK